MIDPIRIHGCWYTVEGVDEIKDSAGNRELGHCDRENFVIRIAETNAQQKQTTLFHEVVHAALPSLSERMVLMIERELFAALRDNPHLRDYLFRD